MTESAPQQVVINDEDQYSLWPLDQPPPAGWRPGGFTGSKQECLDHIDEVWTDMRPRSVRQRSEAGGAQ
jgi:MbtH protein